MHGLQAEMPGPFSNELYVPTGHGTSTGVAENERNTKSKNNLSYSTI